MQQLSATYGKGSFRGIGGKKISPPLGRVCVSCGQPPESRGGAGKVLFVVAEAELKKEASVKRRGVVPVSVVGLSLAVGNGAMRL